MPHELAGGWCSTSTQGMARECGSRGGLNKTACFSEKMKTIDAAVVWQTIDAAVVWQCG
jgi:hypothetical protein